MDYYHNPHPFQRGLANQYPKTINESPDTYYPNRWYNNDNSRSYSALHNCYPVRQDRSFNLSHQRYNENSNESKDEVSQEKEINVVKPTKKKVKKKIPKNKRESDHKNSVVNIQISIRPSKLLKLMSSNNNSLGCLSSKAVRLENKNDIKPKRCNSCNKEIFNGESLNREISGTLTLENESTSQNQSPQPKPSLIQKNKKNKRNKKVTFDLHLHGSKGSLANTEYSNTTESKRQKKKNVCEDEKSDSENKIKKTDSKNCPTKSVRSTAGSKRSSNQLHKPCSKKSLVLYRHCDEDIPRHTKMKCSKNKKKRTILRVQTNNNNKKKNVRKKDRNSGYPKLDKVIIQQRKEDALETFLLTSCDTLVPQQTIRPRNPNSKFFLNQFDRALKYERKLMNKIMNQY